jgi:hypothetical protein
MLSSQQCYALVTISIPADGCKHMFEAGVDSIEVVVIVLDVDSLAQPASAPMEQRQRLQ